MAKSAKPSLLTKVKRAINVFRRTPKDSVAEREGSAQSSVMVISPEQNTGAGDVDDLRPPDVQRNLYSGRKDVQLAIVQAIAGYNGLLNRLNRDNRNPGSHKVELLATRGSLEDYQGGTIYSGALLDLNVLGEEGMKVHHAGGDRYQVISPAESKNIRPYAKALTHEGSVGIRDPQNRNWPQSSTSPYRFGNPREGRLQEAGVQAAASRDRRSYSPGR
jgi:hypothetical protein